MQEIPTVPGTIPEGEREQFEAILAEQVAWLETALKSLPTVEIPPQALEQLHYVAERLLANSANMAVLKAACEEFAKYQRAAISTDTEQQKNLLAEIYLELYKQLQVEDSTPINPQYTHPQSAIYAAMMANEHISLMENVTPGHHTTMVSMVPMARINWIAQRYLGKK